MKTPQFLALRIKDLIPAKYNPKNRTTAEAVKKLTDSISKIGLIEPIKVFRSKEGYHIVDGHRRARACAELGMDTIPALVLPEGTNKEDVYAAVNSTAKKMGGNDALNVWLKEPAAVTSWLSIRMASMADTLGIHRVNRMAKQGYTMKMYAQAKRVLRYLDRDDDLDLLCQTVDWLMDNRVTSTLQTAMAQNVSGRTILAAINKNKPLRLTTVVAE